MANLSARWPRISDGCVGDTTNGPALRNTALWLMSIDLLPQQHENRGLLELRSTADPSGVSRNKLGPRTRVRLS